MAWIYLLIASVFEIAWAIGLKYTRGFTQLWPSVGTVAAMILSFLFLGQAVRTLPIGTAYAVWTGIGAAGTAALGIFLLGEPRSLPRVLCILLILAGVIGLKTASGGSHEGEPGEAADARARTNRS